MNKILALLRWEYSKIRYIKKTVYFIYLASIALCLSGPANIIPGALIVIYFISYSIEIYDERFGCDYFYNSLPVKRSHIVLGKYCFYYSFYILVTLVSTALYRISMLYKPEGAVGYIMTVPQMIVSVFCVGSLFLSITLPVNLILGPTKGRVAGIILYVAGFFSYTFITSMFSEGSMLPAFFASSLFLPIVVVVLIFLSYFIAKTFYEQRQFVE